MQRPPTRGEVRARARLVSAAPVKVTVTFIE